MLDRTEQKTKHRSVPLFSRAALNIPFLLLVFNMNSRARWGAGWGSRGLITILLSRGSPGTICQWWNTDNANALERDGKWWLDIIDNFTLINRMVFKAALHKYRPSNTNRHNTCPCVWVRRSVSNPKESMAGMKALTR